jgi:hypothetical protein
VIEVGADSDGNTGGSDVKYEEVVSKRVIYWRNFGDNEMAHRVAAISFLALLAGCQHKQTNNLPSKASAPVLVQEQNVDIAKAVHVGPASLYPNPVFTVGKADTLSVADLTASYSSPCPAGKATCNIPQVIATSPTPFTQRSMTSTTCPLI